MGQNYLVRKADIEDVEIIASFNVLLAEETEKRYLDKPTVLKGVKGIIKDPGKGFYLVLEKEKNIAGQLMIAKEWSDWRNKFFWWMQFAFIMSQLPSDNILLEFPKNFPNSFNMLQCFFCRIVFFHLFLPSYNH